MIGHRAHSGFSAAELLVTLFIAAAFIGAAAQLYTIAVGDSGHNRTQAIASNLAYSTLRSYSNQIASSPAPCASSTASPSPSPNSGLSGSVSISVTISCPYGASSPTISQVVVTITYGIPSVKLTHSVYVSSSS